MTPRLRRILRIAWAIVTLAGMLVSAYHTDKFGRGDAPLWAFLTSAVCFFLHARSIHRSTELPDQASGPNFRRKV
jgi:hypothetical protein